MTFWSNFNFQKVAIFDCLGEEGGAEQNEEGHGAQKRADSPVNTLPSFLSFVLFVALCLQMFFPVSLCLFICLLVLAPLTNHVKFAIH